MKVIRLIDNEAVFGEKGPYAQQINSDQLGKIVRYTIKEGQELDETHAPFMPRYFIVVKGEGIFISEDGQEETVGENSVVIFSPKEENSIKAVRGELVVIGLLFWATGG